ncbi:quinolinate synthase NadA [Kyrpidia spormannii]|uniref:Quinolinate synthase n=1 Tax=Kyrpidia spormannii TaxID=2055160 RepID=A0A6F9EB16_9BACL|nr:quinolinate synthase NadA [Kyrpidia spormannii]CAB3393494.1 quinolinate synthetase [Kyrpidia spormannii]
MAFAECLTPGIAELSRYSSEELDERIAEAKRALNNQVVILGHHYQREDVIRFADYRGDSLQLSRIAAGLTDVQYIVFCGVHFMAETADILTGDRQTVILPDRNAGCSMADMADAQDVEEAWELLTDQYGDTLLPVTYVNSSAAVKAFVGRHGGLTCTSSNAERVFEYALSIKPRILFLPDQHLGRNTAVKLGIPLEATAVYDPGEMELSFPHGGQDPKVILWKGHCSVHQRFEPGHVRAVREKYPGIKVIVHPECPYETVQLADASGSTDFIIRTIRQAPPGTQWAVGTEHNLVHRLAKEHPDQMIISLNEMVCPCLTMNRIDRPHLADSLESLVRGQPTGVIHVPEDTARWARLAIDRMLDVS